MGEIILKNVVQREKGYMYYVDGAGNLCKAKMGRVKKEKEPKPEPIVKLDEEIKKETEQPTEVEEEPKKNFFSKLIGK